MTGDARYLAGYEAGRAACLCAGTPLEAQRWLEENHETRDRAFVAGYEWALFDYSDANGLPARVIGAS